MEFSRFSVSLDSFPGAIGTPRFLSHCYPLDSSLAGGNRQLWGDSFCILDLVQGLLKAQSTGYEKPDTNTPFKNTSFIDFDSEFMEEQFVLRVPPSVAERIERLLNENASSSEDPSLDLSFSEDGRSGTFAIGDDHFPASLLDLPCVVESYKTYDDTVLIKAADIAQMIMVREPGDPAPDSTEYRHGLTPPMRDARKRRFRREPDLNPELVRRVEKDLLNIMAGGTTENADVGVAEHQDDKHENSHHASAKPASTPAAKPDVMETETTVGEPERSDSDDSDHSID
ncbi:transcription initiation factor TFIID subunit 7 isoform X2 [Cucurbita maxima]|uniref:Transcription initiation factor TFIID subunit 7 isoform X2 n=1 Tax=Cucurbita maxima TaxID=3661 RepID=A0A6J1JSC8_CUCMA|nr:transcription initiation factor TFIID subunit 7 isoform X2 [Cucurbita maxima]